jgi:hypothetical protein
MAFSTAPIEIAAKPADVWSLLIDCTRWSAWYKHCEDVSLLRGDGVLALASQFRFKTIGTYFEPEITAFVPARMLVWQAPGAARDQWRARLVHRADGRRLFGDN